MKIHLLLLPFPNIHTGLALLAVALLPHPSAFAGIVETDMDIPALISAPGTEEDPALFILGESAPVDLSFINENVFVGWNGAAWNSLIIQTGSTLTLTPESDLYIGFDTEVGNNSVVVTGVDSTLNVGRFLDVGGDISSSNWLTIEEGGTVNILDEVTGRVEIGFTSDDNTLTVEGDQSTLNAGAGGLLVGVGGSGNSMFVLNGGMVRVPGGDITIGQHDDSTDNQFIASGFGTVINADSILLGPTSVGNSLLFGHGANVTSRLFIGLGNANFANQGSDHTATITDMGTVVNTLDSLIVGSVGSRNSLLITNGARVLTQGSVFVGSSIGNPAFGADNALTVSGFGSRLDVDKFTNNDPSTLWIGIHCYGNTLTISNGGLVRVDGSVDVSGPHYQYENNFIRLNGGFFALSGDQTAKIVELLNNGVIQVSLGAGWELANIEKVDYAFFPTDGEAALFTGYEGLGGYTILTSKGGNPYANVPQPLQDSYSFSSSYFLSAWFGGFFVGSQLSPNLFTEDFGWVSVDLNGTPEGMWWWSYNMGSWLWGSANTGRNFYRAVDNTWIYVESYQGGGSSIYNYTTNQWSYLAQ